MEYNLLAFVNLYLIFNWRITLRLLGGGLVLNDLNYLSFDCRDLKKMWNAFKKTRNTQKYLFLAELYSNIEISEIEIKSSKM